MTYGVNIFCLHTEQIKKYYVYCTTKESLRALFPIEQQPHSMDVFLSQNILPLDKLINNQEGILAYKGINGTYLLVDILTDTLDLHHCQLKKYKNLRNPLHLTTHSQLFICYRSMKTWNILRDDLRSASFLTSFRRKLNEWITKNKILYYSNKRKKF